MDDLLESQDRAYYCARRKLLEGRVPTRQELSRRRLAEESGVSPGCAQFALSRLESEGLLVSRPQSGTYLRPLDLDEYHQLYDLRELIEPYAAGRAAAWLTGEQLERLEESCAVIAGLLARLEKGDEPPDHLERAVRAEHLFHGTIMGAARNPMAAHFVENLRILNYTHYYARRRRLGQHTVHYRRTVREHRAILEALRARDAAAAERRMRTHVRNGRFRLVSAHGVLEAGPPSESSESPEG
jgi:DNA-binding GntR family transcriptional regulator